MNSIRINILVMHPRVCFRFSEKSDVSILRMVVKKTVMDEA